jgi:thiol-disulfide isomerase/thioredoxin
MVFKSKKTNTMLSFLVILAIIVVVVVVYKKKLERFVSPSSNDGVAVVTYYYLPRCPHCVAFQDEWATFQSTADPSLMTAVSIDASDDSNRKLIASEGISGYPTIRILKNGNVVEYKGARKASSLIDYVSNL